MMQQMTALTGSAALVSGWARLRAFAVRALLLSVASSAGVMSVQRAAAQTYPGVGCVATLENRSVPVDSTGSFVLPNIPVDPGKYRVRVICPQPDGSLLGSTSAFLNLVPLGSNSVPQLPLGPLESQASSLKLQAISGNLSSVGSTVQLEIQAIHPESYAYDESSAAAGATYSSSNLTVATVDVNGLVTTVGPGNVVITGRYDGLVATIMLSSFAAVDSDGDGMPDAYEIANGLNPFDPSDGSQDPDNDGLTNLQEYQLGTNPHVADTDGDGLNDGLEVQLGTNPLVADTDGDGLSDGDEVRLGTNPLNPDTDGDGIPDGIEVKLGLNPLVADVTTTVTGHVTQGNGSPYPGATVVLMTYYTAVTDTTGAFTLLYVPTTLGNLVVSARVIQGTQVLNGSSNATVPVANGTTDVGTIQLGQSSGQVSGIVTSPANTPVKLAQVTVTDGLYTQVVTTDYTGLYLVTGLQAGAVGVAVFDPATSLRGQASGVLSAGGPLTLNVKLGGFGTVAGTVRNASGATVGAGVSVTITGALNMTTATDTLGHYNFAFVPLGAVTLDATDVNGNHGRSSATVTATSQNINSNIQFLGRGTVSGVVTDGTSTPVGGVAVSLNNGGFFNQQLSTTTNSLGQYSFSNVFVGTINLSATSAATSTGGSATAVIQSDAQSVTANIMLQPTATLSGVVFRADGTTVVAGAAVSLSNSALTATTDAAGKYTIANIPLGNYTAMVLDPATGDRGSAAAKLPVAGQTVALDINLLGLGTLVVTVTDGGGTVVSSALVAVTTNGPFYMVQNGVTGPAGTVTFNQQLAGTLTVSASDPVTGLRGTANVTVTANATANVTVTLQSAGTVQGTVYKIDGTTPVAGATVQIDTGASALTNGTGAYALTIVPSGTHRVAVLDAHGNVLGFNNNVVVSTQGQVVTANFVIIGRGTVTGKVTNPDGSAAANIPVSVTSLAPGDGNAVGTQTDVNGIYTVPLVPVGGYNVVAQQHTSTINSYGQASGTVPSEGATVTTNVQLSSSLVPSTVTFTDANGFAYPVRENAGLFNGSFSVFAGDSATHQGGSLLSIVQNGTETAFTGATFAPITLNAQQISIQQNGLDGLNITRRVYVPGDGYFARYVELLQNPTTQDITVDVKLTTNYRNDLIILRSNSSFRQVDPPHILATSSGDNMLNITDPNSPDHWLTLGGAQDNDPFLPDGFADQLIPAVADVFDGPGAPLKPSTATYGQDTAGTYSQFAQTYAAVTIHPGSTVGLLHFISQENVYAAANAAAARLAQLPPEALTGLAQADINAIQNFQVPAVSNVAPLPSLTNSVGGYVYAADGSTPVPYAGVSYQSADPIFSRVYMTQSDSKGAFSLQGSLHGYVVPLENFTVGATHPITQVVSPNFTGSFGQATTVASQDIVFTDSGTIQGTISRGPTVLNVAGTVVIGGGGLQQQVTIPIKVDGTYQLTGVPAGTYTVTAYVTNTLLTGVTTATVTLGQTTTANITIGGSGNIQGLVTRPNGSLAVGDFVNLRAPGVNPLTTAVDTSGHYMFTDLPIGMYTVDSYDGQSNSAASAKVAVTSNATTTQDLALVSSGTVTGVVAVNDGSSVANLTITLTSMTTSGTQTISTTTDATGHYTFTNVKPGTIQLRTTTPAGLQGVANGGLPLAGQTVTINMYLTAAGSLTGTVFQADGTTPAVGIQVMLSPAPLTGSATTTTDANGMYSYNVVAIGGFTVYATNTVTGDRGSSAGQIQTNGQARVINVTLNGIGSLTVVVQDANSHVIANAAVTLRNQTIGQIYNASTDATGTARFTNIFAGSYNLTARDPVTGLNAYTSGTLVAGSTQTITVKLQSAGNVVGVIYMPDGVTPVANATVSLSYGPSTTTAADGSYSLNSVQLGYYSISASLNGVVRAIDTGIQLQTNGMTITHNLTFIGLGSVSGKVTQVDGTPLNNAQLQVYSANSTIGGYSTVFTGGDGTYTIPSLPVGNFTVTVAGLDPSLAGFGHSSIATDGQHVTLDIQLVSSTVTLPVTLTDADGFTYHIASNGAYGSTGPIGGLSPFYSAQTLTLNSSSGQGVFGQGGAPTTALQSLGGQQIEINQPSLAGLNVTRKIYVPTDGYFSRRLEVLQNTSASPITVSINIGGPERYTHYGSQVVTTSNNNTTIDNSVLWAVDDDDNGTQPYPRTQPAVANVFAGTGAPVPQSNVTGQVYFSGFYGYGNNYYYLQYWNSIYTNVVVPANSTVSFLSFTAQEAGSSTAITAAQRLEQLPAEALAGLSTADLASVVNFVIPTTQLAPVQPTTTTGTLGGHVFAGDGATPIPNASVYAQSTDLYFGFGTGATADAMGLYSIPSLPANSYAAEAVDPGTGVTSVVATGTYTAGQPNQTQDIPFTGTGIVQGLVAPTGAATFTGGGAGINWSCPGINYCGYANATFGPSGVFSWLTVPAGFGSIYANVSTPQGGSIHIPLNGGNLGINVVANQTTPFTLQLAGTGSIVGTVSNADGTPAVGVTVYLNGATAYFSETTTTDSAGHFVLANIPVDTYSVGSRDPVTSNFISRNTVVVQDITNTVNLTFIGKGTVVATVHYANGNIGQNANLYISTSTVTAFNYAGTTDGNGQFTFNVVPSGPYTVRAYYPNQNFYSTTTGTITGNNQTTQLAITLTPVGTISGKVANADGSIPAAGQYVQVVDTANQYSSLAQTDSAGNYGFFPVPADRTVSVYSNLPNNNTGRTVQARANNVQVPGDSQTLTVNLRYPGFATVQVTALKPDNTPYTTGYIQLNSADGFERFFANVGPSGMVTFSNVSEATFVAFYNPYGTFEAGSTVFTLGPSDDGKTKQVTIHTSPSGTVQGQVFAADGQTPIAVRNLSVVLTDIDTNNQVGANTNDPGMYAYTGVQTGASGFKLTAQLQGFPSTVQTATGNITTDGQTITQNFTLPVSSVSGTVFLNDGVTPVPYISVYTTQTVNGNTIGYTGVTDANGFYEIPGLLTGTVTLTATDDNSVYGTKTVTLASDTDIIAGANINLGPVGTVMGIVYDNNGSPVPNMQVDINSSGGQYGYSYNSTTTDNNGNYVVTDVPTGNINVSVYMNDGTSLHNTGVLVNNGDTITVNLGNVPVVPAGTVFGTVFDSNQDPAAAATVTITNADATTITVITDDNGMYTATGVLLGNVSISAVLNDGNNTVSGPVTGNVPDALTPVEIDLGLNNAGQVSGIIYDANQNPLGGVDITLNTTGDPNTTYFEQNAGDGTYGYGNIPAGVVTINVFIQGTSTLIGTGTATLPYGGNVTINVTTQ